MVIRTSRVARRVSRRSSFLRASVTSDTCAAYSASTVIPTRLTSRSSGCTRCSIAARSRSASCRSTRRRRASGRARWGTSPTRSRTELAQAARRRSAVGHTRYSTAARRRSRTRSPSLARSRGGYIALAHNGNLINAGELRVELEDRDRSSRRRWTPRCSSIASRDRRPRRPRSGSPTRCSGVEGAYSSSSRSATRCSRRAIRAAGVRS